MDTINQAVAALLSTALNRPVEADGNIEMISCRQWDSMKHIEIIMLLEERFGVSIEPQDIPLLTSQRAINEMIRKLRHA